jgi:hypothetical protein
MRTALLLLLALAASALSSTATAAESAIVWKWVDDKGVTHYSDQPVPGATRIEVRSGNVADRPEEVAPPPSAGASQQDAAVTRYRNFEIWRPENDQVFTNTAGQVNVEIRIEPAVQPMHTLNLYLDGKLVTGFARNALSYSLSGISRGTHNVTATVTDRAGKQIQESASVVFVVRQESIANPPVGPSLRPPPKPQPRAGANKMPTSQPTYGALNGAQPLIDPATNLPVVKKPAPKPGKP